MFLVKSCDNRHNIKVSNTIKLGTLYCYRSIEQKELVDFEEGIQKTLIEISGPLTLKNSLFNTLNGGAITSNGSELDAYHNFPGRIQTSLLEMTIDGQNRSTITIRDAKCLVEREDLNSFIFCVSLLNNLIDAGGLFECHNSVWSMKFEIAHEFGTVLGKLLLSEVYAAVDRNEIHLPEGKTKKDIRISMKHKCVDYIDRHLIYNEMSELKLEELINILSRVSFIKPLIYAQDKEYRFQYYVLCGNILIEPWQPSVILDASPLLAFVD